MLQGGGALGAYQVGVYQALHEAGIEPDWVVGTSIGAINASIIAGNPPEERLPRLREFWRRMDRGPLDRVRSRDASRGPHVRELAHHRSGHPELLHAEPLGLRQRALAAWRRERGFLQHRAAGADAL